MAKTKEFEKEVTSFYNKKPSDIQKEDIKDTIADFIIETESQISLIKTSDIPKQKQELKKTKRLLTKKNKALKEAYIEILDVDYEAYMRKINLATNYIGDTEAKISQIEAKLVDLEKEEEKYKTILEKLQS